MAGNELDISTLSLDQLNNLKQSHENELNQLSARHGDLKQAEGRFRQSSDALSAIKKEDEGKKMRWCGGCSKAHAGAVSQYGKKRYVPRTK